MEVRLASARSDLEAAKMVESSGRNTTWKKPPESHQNRTLRLASQPVANYSHIAPPLCLRMYEDDLIVHRYES